MMDIYDDFDPQQYYYDESDQEDDIVYLEGPVQGEDPFLPYLAKDLSQSQPTQQEELMPNLLPRRERKRRREEQMMQESSDSEHSNHDERDQDAFASLQSLFEKHTQQEKEKKVGALSQEESVANDDAKEEETTLQENETKEETTMQENESSSMGHQERNHEVPVQDNNDNVIPESQSQFPLAEDWEPSQEEANLTQQTTRPAIPMVSQHYTAAEHTNVSSINTPSISSGLIKELHRAQQKKNAASKPLAAAMNPPRVVDSNLLSELEKNRKREALEKKTTRPRKQIAGGSSINKSLRPQFHRNRPQKTQVAEDTKSIVGSR